MVSKQSETYTLYDQLAEGSLADIHTIDHEQDETLRPFAGGYAEWILRFEL